MKNLLILIYYKTLSDLKSEARKTCAGYLWWMLEPLLQLAVYYAFFTYIFTAREPNYALFLFIGLVSWRWFQASVLHSANSLIINRSMTQVIDIDKAFFPLEVVCVDLVKYVFSLLLVLITLWCSGIYPDVLYVQLPILILLQYILTTGCSLVVAGITPFFPDFYLLLQTWLQLMMFLSGIFYSLDSIPGVFGRLLSLNPMGLLIQDYRRILLNHESLSWSSAAYVLMTGVVLWGVGLCILRRFNKLYPKLG